MFSGKLAKSLRRRSDALGPEKIKYKAEVLEATLEEAVEQLEDKEKSLQLAAQIGQALTEREELLGNEVQKFEQTFHFAFKSVNSLSLNKMFGGNCCDGS